MGGPIYGVRDQAIARKYERERFDLVGVEATYYSLNRDKNNVDPLYNEPCVWNFEKFCLKVHVQFEEKDDKEASTRDEGIETMFDGIVHMAVLEWTEKSPVGRRPKEGDVINAHETFFDVVLGASGGKVVDLPDFVGFKLNLKRRSKFIPERKVDVNLFET